MTESPSDPAPPDDAGDATENDAAATGPAVAPPPDAVEVAEGEAPEPEVEADPAAEVAAQVAAAVGATGHEAAFGTAKVRVERERWLEAVATARDQGFDFFSWLSAVDWAREVAVGETVEDPDALEERYEVLCRLSTVVDDRGVILAADVPKDDAVIDSLTPLFGGAAWHERETHEMFGIDFRGHPRLIKLYLPDAFEGFPLRKDYPLLSREVKPWPGLVDVEGMPEADEAPAAAEAAGTADEVAEDEQ